MTLKLIRFIFTFFVLIYLNQFSTLYAFQPEYPEEVFSTVEMQQGLKLYSIRISFANNVYLYIIRIK